MDTDKSIGQKLKSYMPSWFQGSEAKEDKAEIQAPSKPEAQASVHGSVGSTLFAVSYTGEKSLGGMGPIKDYKPAYEVLRLRSWQAYLESDIAQTVLNRFLTWVIGPGLKLQSEPVKAVLKMEGLTLDAQVFSKAVESRFKVFAESEKSDYTEMQNLDFLAKETFKNAINGGDVLVILRMDDNNRINVQLIDGSHIQSPLHGTDDFPNVLANGNVIRNGIEQTKKGKHVKFWIRNKNNTFDTVDARGETSGLQMAFLVYGLKYRLDNNRGLPLLSAVLESTKKLERYKEATLGSAEERQKITMSIEHDLGSTGENPMLDRMAQAQDFDGRSEKLPKDINGKELADGVAASTEKTVVNMPQGASLKSLESKNELYFKDFYNTNIELVCAAIGIPPEVALSKYDSNFSASRAALKDWENTLLITRHSFAGQFYKKIYSFWLEMQVAQNKIKAPGFIDAILKGNDEVLTAYKMARFIGPSVPHIDPLKEVKAEREKLGKKGENVPLTTVEAATELLNSGESDANMDQFSEEIKKAEKLGLGPEVVAVPNNEGGKEGD